MGTTANPCLIKVVTPIVQLPIPIPVFPPFAGCLPYYVNSAFATVVFSGVTICDGSGTLNGTWVIPFSSGGQGNPNCFWIGPIGSSGQYTCELDLFFGGAVGDFSLAAWTVNAYDTATGLRGYFENQTPDGTIVPLSNTLMGPCAAMPTDPPAGFGGSVTFSP